MFLMIEIKLVNCESFIHVDIVSLLCSTTFLFEWNKEVLHFTKRNPTQRVLLTSALMLLFFVSRFH